METKREVTVSIYFAFYYDPESPEVKEAIESYKEVIDDDGDLDAVLNRIANHLESWGDHESMVEGVGYVGLRYTDGRPPYRPKEGWCGIDVDADYESREVDIDD